jgi:hypothetical protein
MGVRCISKMPVPQIHFGLTTFALALLCIGLVVFLRRKIWKRVFWLAPMLMLAGLLVGCESFHAMTVSASSPTFLPESKLAGLIQGLPDYAPFGYSGLAFYKDKLYASTNVGLIEIIDGRPNGVYRFQNSDSVVSGPWLDTSDQLLWVLDDHANQLLNFDGRAWHRVNLPQPQKGDLTRGDVLEGPRPIGNALGFWLESGGSVWRWNATKSAWATEQQPSQDPGSSDFNESIGVLPIGVSLLFIERHQLLPFLIKEGEDFESDTVVHRTTGWQDIPNNSGTKFLADNWASADGAAYICATSGILFRVSPQAVTKPEAPGKCETLASTSSHTLLASFRNKGIYEYKGKWVLRAAHPYPSGTGDYWTYLSENGSEIALAIVAKPVVDKQRSSRTNMKFTRNASNGLWICTGSEFHSVQVP